MISWALVYDRLKDLCPPECDNANACLSYLYQKGWSIRQIEAKLEGVCTKYVIRRKLVKLATKMRPRGGAVSTKKRITLTESDLTLSGKEIAVKYHISVSYAQQLKRNLLRSVNHSPLP